MKNRTYAGKDCRGLMMPPSTEITPHQEENVFTETAAEFRVLEDLAPSPAYTRKAVSR